MHAALYKLAAGCLLPNGVELQNLIRVVCRERKIGGGGGHGWKSAWTTESGHKKAWQGVANPRLFGCTTNATSHALRRQANSHLRSSRDSSYVLHGLEHTHVAPYIVFRVDFLRPADAVGPSSAGSVPPGRHEKCYAQGN